jgi:DNA adenine methylase
MEATTTAVRPVSPAAPYLGGKRNLSRRLVDLIATIPHETYVEPFVGMGGVFLRRTAKPRVEVINDISADVATLFRILQRHYQAFMDVLKWQITSRAEFERLIRVDPLTLTDLERAARFLYLQRLAFGGKVIGRNFGVKHDLPGRFDVTKLGPMLEEIHDRLSGVVIERLPYRDVIARYDAPETLFYLDPPYWGCEEDYGGDFTRADFEQLAKQLAAIEGKFVLSINATDGAREAFRGFEIEDVETSYSAGGGSRSAAELIVSNGASQWKAKVDLFSLG